MKMLQKFSNPKQILSGLLFYFLLLSLISPVLLRKIASNDIWKALYSGRYLSVFGQFPHHSTFSFSPVQNFVVRDAYNWLGNLFFIEIWTYSGQIGLQIVRIIILLTIILLLHGLINWRFHPFDLLLLVLLGYGISQNLLLRTAIIGSVGLTGLLWCWFHALHLQKTKTLYLIPPLMIIWGNFHGTYLIGFFVLFFLFMGRILHEFIKSKKFNIKVLRKGGIVLLIVFLGLTFVRPFYVGKIVNFATEIPQRGLSTLVNFNSNQNNVQSPKDSYTQTKNIQNKYEYVKSFFQDIIMPSRPFRASEYKFVLDATHLRFVQVNLLMIGIFIGIWFLSENPIPWDWIFLFILIVYLGIAYIRSIGYISIVTIFIVFIQTRKNNFKSIYKSKFGYFLPAIILLIALGTVGSHLYRGSIPEFMRDPYHQVGWGKNPRISGDLAQKMKIKYPEDRFFNNYNQGAYLLWNWWPHKKVFIDTKSHAYKFGFLTKYKKGNPQLLSKYNLKYAFVSQINTWNRDYFRKQENWKIIGTDDSHNAYIYKGSNKL